MSRLSIQDLRAELGMTQEEFAVRVGLSSKGGMSKIERGIDPVSLSVALAIEGMSIKDGAARIDAADLNADIAKARAACGGCVSHDPVTTPATAALSSGFDGALSTQFQAQEVTA